MNIRERLRPGALRLLCWALCAVAAAAGLALAQDTTGSLDRRAASTAAPGRLAAGTLPQFILVTFDDGITPYAESFIQPLVSELRNPDGSKAPVTYFVTKVNTLASLARQRYLEGNELASHTTSHTTNASTTLAQWMWELTELNRFFVNDVGMPSKQIAGFRAPDLLTNNALWHALTTLRFLYDASLSELLTAPPGVSTGLDSFVWPYTLDDGAKTACLAEVCPDTVAPGVWSIPLWDYYDPSGNDLGAMDPAVVSDSTLSASLEYLFAKRYGGNRCPLGLYMHAGQLWSPSRREILRRFLRDKLSKPDVWMITMRGLIEWMRSPVPFTALSSWFAEGRHRGYGWPDPSPPEAASQVTPVDGTRLVLPDSPLLWDVVLNASSYELQIAGDAGFAATLVDTSGLARTVFPLPATLGTGTYWWRVRAVNSRGPGPWSGTRTFILGDVTSVVQKPGLPEVLALDQNYPNPFNPSTVITISLPIAAQVKLAVFDVLGREVAVLLNEFMPPGRHQQTWDASGLPSGVYVCRLQVSGARAVPARKLLLLR